MNTAPTAAGEARIRAYLDEVAAGLHGPRRRRARILTELRDGFDDAVTAHTATGLPTEHAVSAAITQFGTPAAVADAFAAELAIAYARHTLAWFVATGPLVGIWWLLLLRPYPCQGGAATLVAAIPVIPLVAAALAAATSTLATTGRLMRWLPETGPGRALAGVVIVAGLAVTGDLAVIGVYLGSGGPARPLAVVAIAASLIRIGLSLVTIRHAAALRHREAGPVRSVVDRDARR
jgi:HAAS domain-containing protein